MKVLILILFLILNTNIFSKNIYYKDYDNNSENIEYYSLNYPEECKKIIVVSEDKNYEFKNKSKAESIITECNMYIKGNNIKEGIKAGSGAIIDKGTQVKEGITDGFKKGTGALSESVSKETNLFIDDTVKLKDGLVGGASKLLDTTVDKGSQFTKGFTSFFKGVLSFK